jgi:uncharacterized glyoxalase superfamily protein PhnB
MAKAAIGTMYPSLFYRDAPAAIDWLVKAFGFEVVMMVPGEDGRAVAHSELRLGEGFVQVGSADPERKMFSPLDLSGLSQGLYIYWEDVDGIFAQAKAAGAEVEQEPENPEYGGRICGLRDPEGHRWWFGSYAVGSYASEGQASS